MNNTIWAIDPGLDGALVVIQDDKVTYKIRMKKIERKLNGFLKNELDAIALSEAVRQLPIPEYAALEIFNPISGNSKATIASLFRTVG